MSRRAACARGRLGYTGAALAAVVLWAVGGASPALGAPASVPLFVGLLEGNDHTALSVASVTHGGGDVVVSWAGTVTQDGCLKLYVDGVLWTGRSEASVPGCHLFRGSDSWLVFTDTAVPAGTLTLLTGNMGSFTTSGGSLAYDDGAAPPTDSPAPSATPGSSPTASASASPTAAPTPTQDVRPVALSDDDRDIMRLGVFTDVAVGGLTVFLLGVVAMTVFRRG